MKDELLDLVNQTEDIEKLFHRTPSSPGLAIPSVDEIYDVQAFQMWLQAVILEVQEIVDRTNDKFAIDTVAVLSHPFNGWNDRRDFDAIKSKLFAMRKNIDKYYSSIETTVVDKPPKVFISHSSKDKDYVVKIVSLLDDMGINPSDVFCSSLPGYDIPIDTDIFEYLRDQFRQFNLHMIIVHSNNYYQSSVSLNEMGAAWVLRTKCTSFLLPRFGFDKMTGVVNGNSIAIKLDNVEDEIKDKLNQLYDLIVAEFSLQKKATILWEQKRDSFIEGVQKVASESPATAEIPAPPDEDDLELTQNGYYIKKSEAEAGKDIRYCSACYKKYKELYPIAPGSVHRDMFCTNCKMHYRR